MPEDASNRDIMVAIARLTDGVARVQADIAELKATQRGFATTAELQRLEKQIADIAQKSAEELAKIRTTLETNYVPVSRYQFVERVVIGALVLIGTAFVTGVISLVIITP